jgi:hypothetical protein
VYPAWLIMLIGVLAVKCREPTYVGIHGTPKASP